MKAVKLNTDEAQAIAARYAVQGIPHARAGARRQGGRSLVGAVPKPQLRRWLEPHLAPVAAAAGQARDGAG